MKLRWEMLTILMVMKHGQLKVVDQNTPFEVFFIWTRPCCMFLIKLSYFYKFYSNGGYEPCNNETYVTTFDLVTLELCLLIDSMCDIETIDAWEVIGYFLGSWGLFCCCSPKQHRRQCWLLDFNVCGRVAYGDQRYECGCFWSGVFAWESSCH